MADVWRIIGYVWASLALAIVVVFAVSLFIEARTMHYRRRFEAYNGFVWWINDPYDRRRP